MDFTEILAQIMERTKEAYGVLLMGSDGIAIEKIIRNDLANLDILAAEYTNILKTTGDSLKEIETGGIKEIINITDNLIIILLSLTNDYFLFMVLPADSNFGRARFELKRAKYMLEKELL